MNDIEDVESQEKEEVKRLVEEIISKSIDDSKHPKDNIQASDVKMEEGEELENKKEEKIRGKK
jgi:hypothetical protein